ncbi:hypothetical protein THAOC_20091, partial [Thalassiosira oceanica]
MESPQFDGVRKVRRHRPKPPESEESGRLPRVSEDGFLRYHLDVRTILAVKVIIPLDSESEPILTGPGNLVSFFVWGK